MDSARRDLGRKAHDMADHLDKMKNAIIAVVVLLVLSAVPLAALIVGSIGLNQCPIQPMVPIWLLVVGVVGIAGFSCLIVELFCKACCFYEKWKKDQNRPFIYSVGITVLLISLFYCGWLIAGCVWIFSVRPAVQFSDPTSSNYCHQSAYNFAFGFCITQLSLAGTLICSISCGIVCNQIFG